MLFPRQPKGKYYAWRNMVALLLLGFFFGMPFVSAGGHPLFLLNFLERKFIVFGLVFWTQDFHIFALSFLTLLVFIVLFTAVFGRIFCGWICPQTVFLELVFRRLEFWIEGDPAKRKQLYFGPWNRIKITKIFLKHFLYILIAITVGIWFSFWVAGYDKMKIIFMQSFSENTGVYIALLVFSGIFYFVFAWFRENACIFVCPYGRLQSVLLDKNTIVVAYDYKRGEPRGPLSRSRQGEKLGDCVDCGMCKQVCPTGIDIRNGIQLECVNCTACMDACDGVMRKVKRPDKLIRYASMNQIAEGQKFRVTPRIVLYAVVLALLIALVTFFMTSRTDVEVTLLRAPGSLYQLLDNGNVANIYTAKIVNKTFERVPLRFQLENAEGKVTLAGKQEIIIPADDAAETSMIIEIPPAQAKAVQQKIHIGVYKGADKIDELVTSFMGTGLKLSPK